jgi:hypothetical protein
MSLHSWTLLKPQCRKHNPQWWSVDVTPIFTSKLISATEQRTHRGEHTYGPAKCSLQAQLKNDGFHSTILCFGFYILQEPVHGGSWVSKRSMIGPITLHSC